MHSKGIIHRDLKSSNIKINSMERVKLLDFGIARAEGGQRLTRVGAVIGSPETLAPELLEGKPAGMLTEIWCLGVLGYEMVTGQMPFQAASRRGLVPRTQNQHPVPPRAAQPTIPPQFEKVLLRCLDKNPGKALRLEPGAESGAEKMLSRRGQPGAVVRLVLPRLGPTNRLEKSRFQGRNLEEWLALWKLPEVKRAATVVAIALVLLMAMYFFRGSGTGGDMQTVTIEAADGAADVYANGERVGRTPYRMNARLGDSVQLELRRPGYLDQPVQFDVTERKVYSYTLQRARR